MANVTLNTRLVIKNDTASNWTSNNPVLLKGEIGFEMGDEIKFKVGNGTSNWNDLNYFDVGTKVLSGANPPTSSIAGKIGQLYYSSSNSKIYMCYSSVTPYTWKQVINPDDLSDLGAGDMLKSVYDTNNNGIVDNAEAVNGKTVDDTSAASTNTLYTSKKIDDTYVAKESGKGLSTNDYTATDKNKLSSIAQGAEVNVQSDWNESDTTSDAYILNKPTSLPADGGNADTVNNKSVDDTKTTSDYLWTAEKIKSYADSIASSVDAMVFMGVVNSASDLPSSGVKKGATYRVGTAGTYAGEKCEVGDIIIATDNTPTWTIIQTNIDGAVVSSSTTSSDGVIAVYDGTTGRQIKTGTKTISELEYVLPVASSSELGGVKISSSSSDKRVVHINSSNELTVDNEVLISSDSYILNCGDSNIQ